jgi:hypothetical protein
MRFSTRSAPKSNQVTALDLYADMYINIPNICFSYLMTCDVMSTVMMSLQEQAFSMPLCMLMSSISKSQTSIMSAHLTSRNFQSFPHLSLTEDSHNCVKFEHV